MEYKTVNPIVAKILTTAMFLPPEQAKQVERAGVLLVAASEFMADVALQCGTNGARKVKDFYESHLGYYQYVAVTSDAQNYDAKNLGIRLVNSQADGSVSGVQLEFIYDPDTARYYAVQSKVTTVTGSLARTVTNREILTDYL